MANSTGSIVASAQKLSLSLSLGLAQSGNSQHKTLPYIPITFSKRLNVKYLRRYPLYAYVSWEVASCATECSADGFLHQLLTFSTWKCGKHSWHTANQMTKGLSLTIQICRRDIELKCEKNWWNIISSRRY